MVFQQDGTKDLSLTLKDRGDGEGAAAHFNWERCKTSVGG